MDSSDIEVGKYYHIEFLGDWSDFTGDYMITSYASPDTVPMIDSKASLYNIYFDDLGYERSKYELYIKSSTLVFIANKISSKNPLSINTKENVYIPSTLVNFPNSYVYLDGVQFDFTIHSGTKHFDSLTEKDTFTAKTLNDIKGVIEKMDDYAGEEISVEISENETLTTTSEQNSIQEARNASIRNRNLAKTQYNLNTEAAERNLYERVVEATEEKSKYETLASSLSSKIVEVEALRVTNTTETNILNNIKKIMIQQLSMLISGEITVESLGDTGSTAFDNLYEQAKEQINSSSSSS